jgi:solute carrier family 44 protein 1 (choline transporter-like protein)
MLFVNYNAYTVIAIEGSSFCTAAQKALSVIFENALRFAAINSVGDFVLFLSKIIVSALTLLISVFAFEVPINQVIHFTQTKVPQLN